MYGENLMWSCGFAYVLALLWLPQGNTPWSCLVFTVRRSEASLQPRNKPITASWSKRVPDRSRAVALGSCLSCMYVQGPGLKGTRIFNNQIRLITGISSNLFQDSTSTESISWILLINKINMKLANILNLSTFCKSINKIAKNHTERH